MREDRFRQHDLGMDKYAAPINENYAMNVRDYVLRPQAYDTLEMPHPITVTLPPVAEARGRFYSIVAENADNNNTITITDDNDSERWEGDVVLNEKGRGHVFYSDGMKWVLESFGDIVYSSALVAGMINVRDIKLIMTVESAVNTVEAFRATLESNVKTGSWAQAIFAKLDYKTNGLAHGAGSVVCAELTMPASSVVRGTYYVWQSEINCPTNCVMSGNPIAVMSISSWGGAKAQFDDVGLFLDISGVTAADEDFYDESASAATGDCTLKCRINGAFKYLLLADDNN